MKRFTLLFISFFCSNYLLANCNTGGDNCTNPKSVHICAAQSFSENFTIACSNDANSWAGPNGIFPAPTNDIFYEVTITQDPSATNPPSSIEVVVSNMSVGYAGVFFLGTSCNSSNYLDMHLYDSSSDGCQDEYHFAIPGAGTYYFALESAGTVDIRFGGVTGTSNAAIPPTSGCSLGTWDLEDISNCGSYTPFKSTNPSFELCLNGTVLSTNSILTYNLAPATNQLCIRTSFSNPTGGEAVRAIDFNLGPALTASATTTDCSSTTTIAPFSTLPAQNGGAGSWQVSGLTNTTSDPSHIPSGVTVDKKISWLFNSSDNRGDASGCGYSCGVYEFCFEITATNNVPDDTKIVGVFYPDEYNVPASPGNPSGVVSYGCTTNNCLCDAATCFTSNYTDVIQSTPRVIDFEDPAPLPVEMTYFTARADEQHSLLEWATASEENNSHFEVEHGTDGIRFSSIGLVDGNGYSAVVHNYQFIHRTPQFGTNYYRLKQVDFDGTESYSDIKNVSIQPNNGSVTLYPTVTKDFLQLDFDWGMSEDVNIQIYDLSGSLVKTLTLTVDSNKQLDVSHLGEGQYFIHFNHNEYHTTLRFIKL